MESRRWKCSWRQWLWGLDRHMQQWFIQQYTWWRCKYILQLKIAPISLHILLSVHCHLNMALISLDYSGSSCQQQLWFWNYCFYWFGLENHYFLYDDFFLATRCWELIYRKRLNAEFKLKLNLWNILA